MSLLLDTHVLIWWDEGKRISAQASKAIREAPEVFVSAASAWEIAIKTALGHLHPTRTVEEAVREYGFVELPITFSHAVLVASLPRHHQDPFDRLLVAQSKVEKLTLVTRDRAFEPYGLRVVWA